MKAWIATAVAIVTLLISPQVRSDEPIRMLIAAPAGGGTDSLFRVLGRQAAERLGSPVVPVNLPAAGGVLAVEQTMRAAPDGRTIAAVANSTLTSTPHLNKVPFTESDYLPILQVSAASYTMCVSPAFPAATANDFVASLRTQPGKFTVGTDAGIGQLTAARVFAALGLDVRIVPFKGAAEIVVAFLGGHIDIYQGSIPVILPHVAAGKARCVLLTGASASPTLPGAVPLTELGIGEQAMMLTRVLAVHKDTPPAVVMRLTDAFEAAARSDETRRLLAAAGDTFVIVKGDVLRQRLRAEFEALGKVAKRLGLGP